MRLTFAKTLTEMAREDKRIVLLTGDLGYTVLECFAEAFPDRFYNVGVAEQNMLAVASGLAQAGFTPFVYSIGPFAVLRPYEFIRNGAARHAWPVRIVSVGGGFEYAHAGFTHHCLEDIAVMRALPGMTVLAPVDYLQTASVLRQCPAIPGPVYLRLGKDEQWLAPGLDGRFELGRAQVILSGRQLMIFALGALAREAYAAVLLLRETGIDAGLTLVPCIKPEPLADLCNILSDCEAALSVEAHVGPGGLGSLVAENAAEMGWGKPLRRLFVDGGPVDPRGGSERYLLKLHGLGAEDIARAGQDLCGRHAQ